MITAKIVLPDETYHIEPSWRHLPHLSDRHMLAYRSSDVKLSWEVNQTDGEHPKVCGYIKEGLGE